MAVRSPEPTSQQPRRRASKRSGYWALLRAVPRTVARSGFRGLTYRALAKEAGVTYGLISYHFGSREALIEEAARLAVDEAIAKSQLMPESGRVEDFASGLPRLLREDRDAQAFQYDLVSEALRNEKLQEPVAELYRRYVAAVEEALREFGVDDDPALARVVFATLDGLTLQQFIFADEAATDESVARLQELIREVAAARGAATADKPADT
ncbi:MAG TPA: TetR family transcriptional regulator [Solirubrobacterales bacterium]|nr:TetR family transcriptional regulator [Solirubrobacterales bacterium]